MNLKSQRFLKAHEDCKSMQEFGEIFVSALPSHIKALKIPGRLLEDDLRRAPFFAEVEQVSEIQRVMREVLLHEISQDAQFHTESAFAAFLQKDKPDVGVLKFFNGWNETHKTTSLVSAKIIMRLAADALSVPADKQMSYNRVMAHMHEVAKDDFGLGHDGHDGMYSYMTSAFGAAGWTGGQYAVDECSAFSDYLYSVGVAGHKAAMHSPEYKRSIMDAMLVSVASELWNGREYNFIAQFIEQKLRSIKPSLIDCVQDLRNAKGYVIGHSGEVENKHGLHALAAAQAFARTTDQKFDTDRLQRIMLEYNSRVGNAFRSLHDALL
ncbi:hypothetical protein J2W83_001534 [Pseudomonas hunanensis]|uniref:Uncharacterized protein n=1 Tax=Pseudomonas hunanensis TaxID=1247546 RepID=A0ACC6K0G7_9PSED|nr:hypothetical protein [Pseudomonas hunanensis]MDR6711939.1 hypothetical protein [Pseudomonas hunanensis]